MTYDNYPEPCTEEAREFGCICRMPFAHSAQIDPPEPVINEWCPIHGRDPDFELQKLRDDAAMLEEKEAKE